MYFNDSRIAVEIAEQLSGLSRFVTVVNLMGQTDINKGAEDFFCQLLNIGWGLNLKNMNSIQANYPAIDLGDSVAHVCVQVTSENTSTKLSDTLKKFSENKLDNKYNRLIFLVISDKSLPKVKTIPGVMVDVYGVSSLSASLMMGADSQKLKRLNDFLRVNLKSSIQVTPSIMPPLISQPDFEGNFAALLEYLGFVENDGYIDEAREEIRELHRILKDLTPDERGLIYYILKFGDDPERFSGYSGDGTFASISTIEQRVGKALVHELFKSLQPFNLVSVISDYQPDQEGPYVPVFCAHYSAKTDVNFFTAIRKFSKKNDAILRRVIYDADFSPLC